jgi:hypothetical protein
MAIKTEYASKEEIPAGFETLYTETDGKFLLTEVDGMKTEADIMRLQTALTKERADHKSVKTKFAPLANLDVTEVLEKLDRFPELEELAKGKVDEVKLESIVQQRITQKLTPLQRQLAEAEKKAKEFEDQVTHFKKVQIEETISSAILKAAKAAKITDEAVLDDVVKIARFDMELDQDTSEVRVKDGNTLASYFTTMQSKKAHWWGPTIGGGASGSNRGNRVTNNPFSNEYWNLTEQGRLIKEDVSKAKQLAEMAGTSIGGGRPKSK